MSNYRTYYLGDFTLESGITLPDARLAYQTFGELNARRDNAVLLCSFITGTHEGYGFVVGNGRSLDPNRYFVGVIGLDSG
jgi:homoserine O-acetyltransferase/O-succinyltransferase